MNYPPKMTLRPLTGWPTEFTKSRKQSAFKAAFSDTIALLERELRLLDPADPSWPKSVLQIALRERDFRIDGMPRANSDPEHPGVILSIETRNKPALSFPCDTFTHWHDNLRAIALTLEALRKVDRYGVTQTGQQYRGWRAIESRPAEPQLTVKQAIERLAQIADMPPPSSAAPEGVALAFRKARATTHPDRNNGDQTRWDEVEKLANYLHAEGWLDR